MSSKTLAPLFPYQFQTKASHLFKYSMSALALVAQLIGASSYNQQVAGLICTRGTYLGWGFDTHPGCVQEATKPCFSLASMFLFPSSLFLSL